MADTANFGHDRLGHLLEDRLLRVPRFQRAYAWDEGNVDEFLEDLLKAREEDSEYFMGTIVLAQGQDDARQLIVDGQQRLATTAVLLIALRDRLRELGHKESAQSVDQRFLRRFELNEGETVTRLVLSPTDLPTYDDLIDGKPPLADNALATAYKSCRTHVEGLANNSDDYRALVNVVTQLADRVQILLAVATGIPEAYVIFETLNDRGADLTTGDLLKNFLFSQAGEASIDYVESTWTAMASTFDRPEDLVKFLRHEYSSRNGKVTHRKLYKALQDDIGSGHSAVKKYLQGDRRSLEVFLALRDPDHPRWGALSYDIRDSLLAYRRFGFESSMPLLLAVFREWGDKKGGRVVNLVAGWSIRAMMAGRLGGGSAEEAFGRAALAIHEGDATDQPTLRKVLDDWIPDDVEFRRAFQSFGSVTTTRAKYLLGCLNRALVQKTGGSVQGLADWSPKSITIEHLLSQSLGKGDFTSDAEFKRFELLRDQLQNLTLLERNLNKEAADQPFSQKRHLYDQSGFAITKQLASRDVFDLDDVEKRSGELAELALMAWPR